LIKKKRKTAEDDVRYLLKGADNLSLKAQDKKELYTSGTGQHS